MKVFYLKPTNYFAILFNAHLTCDKSRNRLLFPRREVPYSHRGRPSLAGSTRDSRHLHRLLQIPSLTVRLFLSPPVKWPSSPQRHDPKIESTHTMTIIILLLVYFRIEKFEFCGIVFRIRTRIVNLTSIANL